MSNAARIERAGLAAMFALTASAHELALEAAHDARYAAAVRSIRRIAATMDQISDDVLLTKLASVNDQQGLDVVTDGGAAVRHRLRASAVWLCCGVLCRFDALIEKAYRRGCNHRLIAAHLIRAMILILRPSSSMNVVVPSLVIERRTMLPSACLRVHLRPHQRTHPTNKCPAEEQVQ